MQTATQPSLFRSKLFLLGVFLLFLAAVMWLALSLTTAHEQALTPGEKNLGVAALACSLAFRCCSLAQAALVSYF
jgi:hypothetical protein